MNDRSEKQDFGGRVGSFLSRNWKFAALFFVSLTVLMAGILILDSVQRKKKVKSQMLSEDIQDAYTRWLQDNPEEQNAEELEELIEKALDEYPKLFAAQRALFTRGLMALENEEWEEAASAFEIVSEKWEESYLAPVSLYNAGAAKEELGAIDEATLYWKHLVENYAGVSPDVPEALFNLGRLAETYNNDTEEALKHYYELAARFPDSRWTDLSKTRILIIESRF